MNDQETPMTDPSPYDPDLDNALDEDTPPPEDDLLYDAWSIIANASDWRLSRESKQSEEWVAAATRWRDRWHETLGLRIADG